MVNTLPIPDRNEKCTFCCLSVMSYPHHRSGVAGGDDSAFCNRSYCDLTKIATVGPIERKKEITFYCHKIGKEMQDDFVRRYGGETTSPPKDDPKISVTVVC